MKNFLLLLLPVIVFVSCKKEDLVASADANTLSIANSAVISSGKIIFADEDNSGGMVKIYLRKDGVYVLALEEMNYKTMSPTNVYLSSGPRLSGSSIKLFSTNNFCNNIYYTLPSGINIAAFKYIIIQNDADADPAASATLS